MTMRTKLTWLLLAGGALCGVALAADPTQAQGDKKNPAATPSPRMAKGGKDPDANWIKRHEGFVDIAKKGDVNVLFMGDSITDGWRGKAGQPAWEKYFTPLKSANFGIGGDQTQHVLWRLQNGELDGIKPRVVVLMIGTNNTGGNSAEQIAEGITAIVKTIHSKSPDTKVLLLAVFPRGEKADTPVRDKISKINKIVEALDDGGKTVKYMDIGKGFTQPDGSLSKEIMYDYLHLTKAGYDIWGEAIAPTVQKMAGMDGK
jgi:lysophospholipase L1-like esterase